MHFNFHLSGDETPEQSRRIANAVLALGGLLTPAKSVGEITLDLKIDTSEATAALDKLAAHPGASANVPIGYRTNVGIFDHTAESLTEPLIAPGAVWAEEGEPTPDTGATEYLNGIMDRSEALLADAPPVPGMQTVTPPLPPIETKTPATDHNGLPWDERIHSSSRAINADGTWRYRKNVPDETKQAVEAELRGLVQPAQTLDYASHMAQSIGDPNYKGDEYLTGIEAKVAPPVPVPTGPAIAPPVPVSTVQRSYSDVVNLIMANQTTLNKPELYVAVLGMSLPEFAAACIAKPELATVAFNALDEIRRA